MNKAIVEFIRDTWIFLKFDGETGSLPSPPPPLLFIYFKMRGFNVINAGHLTRIKMFYRRPLLYFVLHEIIPMIFFT